MPPSEELLALARAAAEKHALDFTFSVSSVPCTGTALVCAIVEQESAWDAHAIRYEPAFRTRYVAPLGLPPTEEIARSISWGLMQVMGQVAREHGFQGKFLSALCEPAAGLDIGCAVLASKLTSASRDSSVGARYIVPGADAWRGDGHSARTPEGVPDMECGGLPAGKAGSPPLSGITACRDAVGEASLAQETAEALRLRSGQASSRTPQSPAIVASAHQPGQGIALDETQITRALHLWNGGGNPDYAAQVLARLPHYK
ncbi:MAG TPA: transglycosylase SLT domain-containing protein [Candidatus Acidoferrum sp.]|nr:transglycosylase SLT domain-containing protein [Candidatus Acidoferrum sp.]